MRSQSLFAQLLRMTLLLGVVLYGVHHSNGLLVALSDHAMDSGCHAGDGASGHHQHTEKTQAPHHHPHGGSSSPVPE
ncbi:hypothetical protein SAMN04488540_1272 [Ferrimonas sediminum]|uniref:Uncharacterized protein n=1 Tax=Ferrimonas sediminum TaxID=718193 RepID=A0A1G9B254_9GAMM|nr:hypothetical protein [Ferrimonas sediminum]SDK33676.1 hypothetical protein SAMN04488540_1272 [Ferrimonas sediminum]